MNPSPGLNLLNHSTTSLSHDDCSSAHSTDGRHPSRDHPLSIPSADRRSILAPLPHLASQEPSQDSFFASHRAHRSFRGAVDKFHQNPSNTLSNQHVDSAHWVHWSTQSNDFDPNCPLDNHPILDPQPLINTNPPSASSSIRIKDFSRPSGPYRTRSLVHCLVNPPDPQESDPQPHPPDSSNYQPFFYDHHLSPSRQTSHHSANHSNSSATDPPTVLDLPSVFPHDNSSCLMIDSRFAQTTFSSRRNKDGLPSNSHHLLNSPELKTALINPPCPDQAIHPTQVNQADAQIPQGSEPQHFFNQSIQTNTQSSKSTRSTAYRHSTHNITPLKSKPGFNPPLGGVNSLPEHSNHPPSDDAASILLELSRHEIPKHGMSLRRGRGGPSLRSDPQQARSPDAKPPPPPTPSGRRYRTRSQITEEAALNDSRFNQTASSVPDYPQDHPDIQYASQLSEIGQDHFNNLPSGLDYGLGAGNNQGLISVPGSTSVSTCTSRSNTGDGSSSLNITPGHDSSFSLYNLVGKPHVNVTGRLHLKLPGGSSSMSMTHSSASTPNVNSGATLVDDDAKSSFSISTQATSLISPPAYISRRIFPAEVPIDPHFPRLYRTFFVPSAFGERESIKSQAEAYKISVMKPPANSNYNTPAHGYLDLYTPRYVKGVGVEKLGLCCICAEPKDRGGEDTALWLKMKVSSYSYHLSFFHGINNADGLPFSPPLEIRLVKRCHVAANEKLELKEGRCHQCNKWVPMEGVKMQEVKVPELFWWKHAKSCHKSRIAGECNVHIQDEIFDLVTRQQPVTGTLYNGTPGGYLPGCSTPYSYYSPNDLPSSNSPYAPRYHPASPAPTCASSVSQSGGSRVHPSVAAQRASAGRVYKRKSSNSSLGGRRRDNSNPSDSPQSTNWQPLALSNSISNHSTSGSTSSAQSIHQNLIQRPQSPTPNQPNYPPSSISRKTRRSNMLN